MFRVKHEVKVLKITIYLPDVLILFQGVPFLAFASAFLALDGEAIKRIACQEMWHKFRLHIPILGIYSYYICCVLVIACPDVVYVSMARK